MSGLGLPKQCFQKKKKKKKQRKNEKRKVNKPLFIYII